MHPRFPASSPTHPLPHTPLDSCTGSTLQDSSQTPAQYAGTQKAAMPVPFEPKVDGHAAPQRSLIHMCQTWQLCTLLWLAWRQR